MKVCPFLRITSKGVASGAVTVAEPRSRATGWFAVGPWSITIRPFASTIPSAWNFPYALGFCHPLEIVARSPHSWMTSEPAVPPGTPIVSAPPGQTSVRSALVPWIVRSGASVPSATRYVLADVGTALSLQCAPFVIDEYVPSSPVSSETCAACAPRPRATTPNATSFFMSIPFQQSLLYQTSKRL